MPRTGAGDETSRVAAVAMPRRAELLAALSLAIDLGLGQPMEHMLRSSVLGARLSEELGLDDAARTRVFYATLLAWIGCHADSYEIARGYGDDIDLRAGSYRIDRHGVAMAAFLLPRVGAGRPPWVRAGRAAAFLATGRTQLTELIRSHCVSAGTLAQRMGIGEEVARLLQFTFERWDGAGLPVGARRDELPLEMRIVHLADIVEVHLREGGLAAAERMAQGRRGTQFDPDLVDTFCSSAGSLTEGLMQNDAWASALSSAPQDRIGDAAELDGMLTALGDFVDLKSPFTAGHSRAVAALAEDAGRVAGLAPVARTQLRCAGLVHDLGRMGIPNTVWDKAAPLTTGEAERVRLHPYLTERILRRVGGLETVARLAGAHHERVDGSGYPSGSTAEQLSQGQCILAAADSYCSWREPRPHRDSLSGDEAAARLRREVTALHVDADAAETVLQAAGHRPRRRGSRPAGLTERELEVLRLLVRGLSSREVATELVISEKTARHHVEHIYAKLGVSNRISATLFALQHGLLGELGRV